LSKTSLKIPEGLSAAVNHRRTDSPMAKENHKMITLIANR